MSQRYTREVCTAWHNRPLRSIRRVDFADEGPQESLVEVRTELVRQDGKDFYVRLSRDELLQMIKLLDGQPVTGLCSWQVVPELDEETP